MARLQIGPVGTLMRPLSALANPNEDQATKRRSNLRKRPMIEDSSSEAGSDVLLAKLTSSSRFGTESRKRTTANGYLNSTGVTQTDEGTQISTIKPGPVEIQPPLPMPTSIPELRTAEIPAPTAATRDRSASYVSSQPINNNGITLDFVREGLQLDTPSATPTIQAKFSASGLREGRNQANFHEQDVDDNQDDSIAMAMRELEDDNEETDALRKEFLEEVARKKAKNREERAQILRARAELRKKTT